MNKIDFTIDQVQLHYNWVEVIGEETSTSTFLGFVVKEKTKAIYKNSYRIVDAETNEVIETNTDTLPPCGFSHPRLSFKYSSDAQPSNMDDIISHLNVGVVVGVGKTMPKLTIDRPTCTLYGVFITEWNPKIKGGTGSVDYISYK